MEKFLGIFRIVFGQSRLNFQDYFRTIQTEFLDCFLTIQAKFSELYSDSPDRIFGTIFGQSQTVLRFGFDLETNVFGFCCEFWYHCNLLMNETKKKKKSSWS